MTGEEITVEPGPQTTSILNVCEFVIPPPLSFVYSVNEKSWIADFCFSLKYYFDESTILV